jgi:hypothetical protein
MRALLSRDRFSTGALNQAGPLNPEGNRVVGRLLIGHLDVQAGLVTRPIQFASEPHQFYVVDFPGSVRAAGAQGFSSR